MAAGKAVTKGVGNVTIENARIVFRNFAGKEGQYNREGDRNFSVILPEDTAKQMIEDGWNVKTLKARDEGDEDAYHVQVSVSYRNRPPRIVMVTSRGRTTLPEELVEMMDYADLSVVDLIINPYEWAVNGNTGIKAYLKSMFATIQEDELELKYADVPEISMSGAPLELEGSGPRQIEAAMHDQSIIEGEILDEE